MDFDNPKIVERLETIFMPHLAKQKASLKDANNQFVHYTSAENAINIIASKQLWLRSPFCMNDYAEISSGHQQLVKFFNTEEHRKKFFDAMDLYEEGIADLILNGFDEWWKQIQYDTFVASVSVHPVSENDFGRLSMWRAYGDQKARAALVLNNPPDRIKGFNLVLSPALYFFYEDLEREILNIIENFISELDFIKTLERDTVLGTIITTLTLMAVCLKHPGFKEEQEWRIIHLPTTPQPNDLITNSIETIGGIPQIVYKIPLKDFPDYEVTGVSIPKLIDRVIIGPSSFGLALFDAFNKTLTDAGVEDAARKIIISNIPLRT